MLAYDSQLQMLAVSRFSNDALHPGNGVAKVTKRGCVVYRVIFVAQFSTVDLRHTEYVPIHSGEGVIRDASFRPHGENATLLTAAMDKTVKLTSLHSNSVLQR